VSVRGSPRQLTVFVGAYQAGKKVARIETSRRTTWKQSGNGTLRIHMNLPHVSPEGGGGAYGLLGWLGNLSNADGHGSATPAVATNAICPLAASTMNIAQRYGG
jgi:hypothetical protein